MTREIIMGEARPLPVLGANSAEIALFRWSFALKPIALTGLVLGLGVAVIALAAGPPTPRLMAVQCLGWTFSAACLVLLLGRQLRRDLVPDYLGLCKDRFFERDGFCFSISLDREDEMAMFTIMFQSRYLGPSTARIALRPANSGVASVSPDIACGPAGFGVAKFPVAIPRRHQGKTVTFEIGVDASYPLGKGREVRFRTGRAVRHDCQFHNVDVAVQTILHSLDGHFCIDLPTAIRLGAANGCCRICSGLRGRRIRRCSGAYRRTKRCDTRWSGNRTHSMRKNSAASIAGKPLGSHSPPALRV